MTTTPDHVFKTEIVKDRVDHGLVELAVATNKLSAKQSLWTVMDYAVPKELADKCAQVFSKLIPTIPQVEVKNKALQQPLLGMFSEPPGEKLKYFHTYVTAEAWTAELRELAKIAKQLTNTDFTVAYVNLYRSGDFIPFHKDETHKDKPIVSFTFYPDAAYTPRDFVIRENATSSLTVIPTFHRQCLIMREGMQDLCQHALLRGSSERVNVTFRVSQNNR